ncbi:methyltransferase [Nocardiopsis halophila]|uniref:methyltransferase n=1 Tax=Nocardiopsis halophila TaxID=141692 RepID=UPI00036958AA
MPVNAERAEAELNALASLATPMAVRVAATLRLADRIGGGALTAAEAARAAGADTGTLDRLLRHLCTAGVLHRDGEGRYSLTPVGEVLRADHPSGARARLDLEGAEGSADLSLTELLHAVRTGGPAFDRYHGRPFWRHLDADPALAASFHHRMGTAVGQDAPAIVSAYDWGSLGRVVDVGGGNATLLIALLRAYPGLRGAVVDLPGGVEEARRGLAAAGLRDRGEAVAGSFFEPLPAGAGGYLLSAVLHNWGDGDARAILRRCAEAAGARGRVFVIEKLGPDGRAPSTEADLRMAAYFGGRERDRDEIGELAASAGLAAVAVHAAGANAVVECAARR